MKTTKERGIRVKGKEKRRLGQGEEGPFPSSVLLYSCYEYLLSSIVVGVHGDQPDGCERKIEYRTVV
jgi:hypothetical protein